MEHSMSTLCTSKKGGALLIKHRKIKLVGTKRRTPIFVRKRGLPQRIFRRKFLTEPEMVP